MLEIAGLGTSLLTGVGPTLAYRRRFVWHKQELFKGRNIVYGTGWAGWGFESNTTAAAANAAPPGVLRDLPIFEHDPADMFASPIAPAMRDAILAKGIPALSSPVGVVSFDDEIIGSEDRQIDMNNLRRADDWCRNSSLYGIRWLHSDVQNVAFYYTYRLFSEFVFLGGLE